MKKIIIISAIFALASCAPKVEETAPAAADSTAVETVDSTNCCIGKADSVAVVADSTADSK